MSEVFPYDTTTAKVLETLSWHYPEAIGTYFHILNRTDKNGCCNFDYKMVIEQLSMPIKKFRGDIQKLAREDLIEWHLKDDVFYVQLVSLD